MKIVLLTCVYKRPEIFKLFLSRCPAFPLVIVGEQTDPCHEVWQNYKNKSDSIYLFHDNEHLGKRWNYGLSKLKNLEFDYVFITGSDDIFTPNLWKYYQMLNVHYAGLLDFYFYDNPKDRLKYCPGFNGNRQGEPHGAGRMIHRSVLEALEWTLWQDNLERGLDASMTARIRKLPGLTKHFFRCRDIGEYAVDLKSDINLHQPKEYPGVYLDMEERNKFLQAFSFQLNEREVQAPEL